MSVSQRQIIRLVASASLEMSVKGGGQQTGTEPESFDVKADDGHSLKVWAKGPKDGTPVVLLHGRTWSARPVWDLQVEDRDGASDLGASTMDLMASHNIRTYAPDMRGLGGTERDEPGWTTPTRCVKDVQCVMEWLEKEHGVRKPLMVGWSQGGVVAHLYGQSHGSKLSGLVLYASIYDPAPSEVVEHPDEPPVVENTWEGAMEDWTIPGIIDDAAAEAYGHEALKWDPRKVSWKDVHEFDACDPAKLTLPTLVIHGEKDAYTDMEKQRSLFMGVACGDKCWRVVDNADHPVHLYPKQRKVWMSAILSFMEGL